MDSHSLYAQPTTYAGWIVFNLKSPLIVSVSSPSGGISSCTHLFSFSLLPHKVQQMLLLTICSLHIYTISIAFLPNILYLLSNYLSSDINNKNLTPPSVSHIKWENQEWYHSHTDLQKHYFFRMKLDVIQTYLRNSLRCP